MGHNVWLEHMPHYFTEDNEARRRWHLRYDSLDKYQRMMLNYYRRATEVDSTIGQIIQELRCQGEYDNTLIIFTTGNGNFRGEKRLAEKWYHHQVSQSDALSIDVTKSLSNFRYTTLRNQFV